MEIAFLVVSCVAALWQSWMCYRLIAPRDAIRGSVISRGLIRTSACRIGAAGLYVFVGVNALSWGWSTLRVAFATFAFTQLMWCLNGYADAQLRKRLANTPQMTRGAARVMLRRSFRRPTLKILIDQMEARIMSKLDDLETQFTAAITAIATELQTEVSNTDDAVAARLQPLADRLTALGTNPQAEVPAASGNTGSGGTSTSTSGSGSSTDSGSSGGATGSTDAGTPSADGTTGSTASA